MQLLHSNFWWSEGVDLLNKGFTYLEGLDLYRKRIRNVDDVWDCGRKDFVTWGEAQERFNLLPDDETIWGKLTDKVAISWRAVLKDDLDTTYVGIWIGLYGEGSEDLILVVQCTSEFTRPCFQYFNVSLPIPVLCFTVGTHSCCLRAWVRPVHSNIGGIFHEVKIMHTTRGPKKDKEEDREEITFILR